MRVLAPAKVNLYLHVTGKRADGYHLLDSLLAFADIGDELSFETAPDFSLSVIGPFAKDVPPEGNLVETAARKLCARLDIAPAVHITLTKNLPVGAGIGGGSADAAATIRGLLKFFGREAKVADLLLSLGADVPACYHSAPLRLAGIGEQIELVKPITQFFALLVNPRVHCSTPAVFKSLRSVSKYDNTTLPRLIDQDAAFRFLHSARNDLTQAAISVVPDIQFVLNTLEDTDARLVRMSGSGATCFALFDDAAASANASDKIKAAHPEWWTAACVLRGA